MKLQRAVSLDIEIGILKNWLVNFSPCRGVYFS